jgi:urease accessory protein
MTRIVSLAILFLVGMAGAAGAHPGHGATGLLNGFAHPFTGLDHLAAMIAVGLLAARIGGKALWLVPGSFLTMMAVGGTAGLLGYSIPYTEAAIAVSVAVLGAAAILRWRMPVALAVALAGFFAIFHGLAHGAEMPESATGFAYAAGFVSATAVLHLVGIGMGLVLGRRNSRLAHV